MNNHLSNASSDWFLNHIPVWQTILSTLKGKPHVQFLEIGSWGGRSACWLLRNILTHPTSRLTCVDIFTRDRAFEQEATSHRLIYPVPDTFNIEAEFDANIQATGASDRVTKFKGKSQHILRSLPLGKYHGIYIDGSHLACDVLTDAILCADLLTKDGILIFDDDYFRLFAKQRHNPRSAIGVFVAIFAEQFDVLHAGWQIILRKRADHRTPKLAWGPKTPKQELPRRPSSRWFRLRQWLLKLVLGL